MSQRVWLVAVLSYMYITGTTHINRGSMYDVEKASRARVPHKLLIPACSALDPSSCSMDRYERDRYSIQQVRAATALSCSLLGAPAAKSFQVF